MSSLAIKINLKILVLIQPLYWLPAVTGKMLIAEIETTPVPNQVQLVI